MICKSLHNPIISLQSEGTLIYNFRDNVLETIRGRFERVEDDSSSIMCGVGIFNYVPLRGCYGYNEYMGVIRGSKGGWSHFSTFLCVQLGLTNLLQFPHYLSEIS